MRFSDLLTMSVNNLFRRKLRTFLTVLGVVIGTASIVVMVSIGIGLKEFTIKQYSSYGSLTAIQVYNYDNGNSSDKKNPEDSFMTDETMKTFEKIPHVTSAYPDLNLNVIMRQGVYEGNVQLHGIPLGAMKNIKLGEGSLPTAETKDMEMVVGNMVAQNFSNAKTRNTPQDKLLPLLMSLRGSNGSPQFSTSEMDTLFSILTDQMPPAQKRQAEMLRMLSRQMGGANKS